MQIKYSEDEKTYYIVDMNSKHGVFINNRQIDKEAKLNDYDYIQIGETVILFTHQDFEDKESAMNHYKKIGERRKDTYESINKPIY